MFLKQAKTKILRVFLSADQNVNRNESIKVEKTFLALFPFIK